MTKALGVLCVMVASGAASAATLRVPEDFATIQAAVQAASGGDRIRVGPGKWCGASVDKRVRLEGWALPTIVGCATPTLDGLPLRVGFLLGAGASGSQVRGFAFDGRGVSNTNTTPLAFAVFARSVDDVVITGNVVVGTAQALTNTGGSGWLVDWNAVFGLTAFTCDGFCGGGDGIVFQQRDTTLKRAVGNSAEHNFVSGVIPNGLKEFDMTGIVIFGQKGATASFNLLAIPKRDATVDGIGVLVSDRCCGEDAPFATSVDSVIVGNDGRRSDIAVRVTRDFMNGTGNTEGAFIAGNRGVLDINGTVTVGLERLAPTAPRARIFE
ncbi:MAG TPA: hypothetical protein VF334_02750 [Polyangia bacterium]